MAVEYLGRIPRKVVYVLILLAIVIPLFFPLNLPITVSPETQVMFDHIESLEGTGERIIYIAQLSAGFWGEQQHYVFAFIQHVLKVDGVKLILAPLGAPESAALLFRTLDGVSNPLNKQYGEDYVVMPIIPGPPPVVMVSLGEDFRGLYTTDDKGTPIDALSVLDGVNTLEDFEIVVFTEAIKGSATAARVLYPRFPDNTFYVMCNAEGFVFCAAYIGPGLPYTSAIVGVRPAAEYQLLYGGPFTDAIAQMDAVSAYHILGIVLIIFGNVALVAERMRKTGVT